VTPGFFDVTRQRLLAGRLLRSTDDEHSPYKPDDLLNDMMMVDGKGLAGYMTTTGVGSRSRSTRATLRQGRIRTRSRAA